MITREPQLYDQLNNGLKLEPSLLISYVPMNFNSCGKVLPCFVAFLGVYWSAVEDIRI